MKIFVPEKLKELAEVLPKPLYMVGGYVRNALIGNVVSDDADLSSALSEAEVISAAEKVGFFKVAEYKTTRTAVVCDGERKYEYAAFREEKYEAGGGHTPIITIETNDIKKDALRRDFKCNAIYYDIKNEKIVDPLGGTDDIKRGVIDTVISPKEVFSRDGLRLMRLARFVSELGLKPTPSVIAGAREFADNINDISKERIYAELKKTLVADGKYPFSPKDGHYAGLKVLDETRVLDRIFPDLTAGRGMVQRSDYHDHDVLEHSLRAALYSKKEVRLAALLHDIGKPYQMINTGRYKGHAEVGAKIAKEALIGLKADKKNVRETEFLVANHMRDLNGEERKNRIRRLFADNLEYAQKLVEVKAADVAACKDDLSENAVVKKWKGVLCELKTDGTPIKVKDLKISAEEVMSAGFSGKEVGEELNKLRALCIDKPSRNERGYLLKKIKKDAENARGAKND